MTIDNRADELMRLQADNEQLRAENLRLLQLLTELEHWAKERAEEKTWLLEAERVQARRQAALFRLTAALAESLDETEVCRRVVEGLRDVDLHYDWLGVFIVDEAAGDRVLVAGAGLDDSRLGEHLKPGAGLSERAILEPRLHYTPDVKADPRYVSGLDSGSEVDVPLMVDGKVIGVLVVESREPNAFAPEDLDTLAAAAGQASVAIARARLLTAERRRAAALDAVFEASLSLTSNMDLESVLRSIVESTNRLMHGPRDVHLFLFQDGKLIYGSGVERGVRLTQPFAEPRPGGLTYTVAREGKLIVVPDMSQSPLFAGTPWRGSIVGLPLKIGSRVVGVMNFAYSEPQNLADDELNVLRLLGDQAAIAIENARLFGDLRARAVELATIAGVTQALSSLMDTTTLINLVGDKLREVFAAETGFIGLHDLQTSLIYFPYYWVKGKRIFTDETIVFGEGLTSAVLKSRQPQVINTDWERRAAELGAVYADGVPAKCSLTVPILAGEEAIGVVSLQSLERENLFTDSDVRLLTTVAANVGVAIERARLFTASQQQRQFFEAL
ncbi:MAG TPA: GAF domain-containing protein, partial [Anaerolineales bacterium]|nr:GAF domain-containing protein [Anaerolineales bacterium]